MSEFSANDRDEESARVQAAEEPKSEFSVNDRSVDAPVSINNTGVEYQSVPEPTDTTVIQVPAVMNTDLKDQIAKQYETKGVTVD